MATLIIPITPSSYSGVTPYNNVSLTSSIFTNKSSIGCSRHHKPPNIGILLLLHMEHEVRATEHNTTHHLSNATMTWLGKMVTFLFKLATDWG